MTKNKVCVYLNVSVTVYCGATCLADYLIHIQHFEDY